MFANRYLLQPLAAAALVCAAGSSQAALTVYTSQAAFLAAVTAPAVDTFDGFSTTSSTPSPLVRTVGAYGYTATSTTGGTASAFFGAGTPSDPWLSSNNANDTITFASFTPPIGLATGRVRAVGANFFGSDILGGYSPADMTLVATDSLGATVTQTLTSPTTTSFLGFISTGFMSSVSLTAVQPATGFVFPTVDNLRLATVSAVPEPGSLALLLAGLGIVGFVARRRA